MFYHRLQNLIDSREDRDDDSILHKALVLREMIDGNELSNAEASIAVMELLDKAQKEQGPDFLESIEIL